MAEFDLDNPLLTAAAAAMASPVLVRLIDLWMKRGEARLTKNQMTVQLNSSLLDDVEEAINMYRAERADNAALRQEVAALRSMVQRCEDQHAETREDVRRLREQLGAPPVRPEDMPGGGRAV